MLNIKSVTHQLLDGLRRLDDGVLLVVNSPAGKPARLRELDGIRGWAAFSVLLFHVFWEMFGVIVPAFRNPFTAGLLNGGFDVALFFILSGDALSAPFLASSNEALVLRSAAGRYLRLTLPIFASCLVIYLLMRFHLVFAQPAAVLVHREDWLGIFTNFSPGIFSVLQFVLRDVYSATPKFNYMPFLWTMPIELAGSFALFGLLLVYKRLKNPLLVVILTAVFMIALKVEIAGFLLGLVLGRLRSKGLFDWISRRLTLVWLVIFILGLYTGIGLSLYYNFSGLFKMPLAFLTLFLIYSSPALRRFFAENVVSQFLGKISFPLYLIHFAVLISLSSRMIVGMLVADGLNLLVIWAIALVTIAVSVVAASIFAPVDRLSHEISRRMAGLVVHP